MARADLYTCDINGTPFSDSDPGTGHAVIDVNGGGRYRLDIGAAAMAEILGAEFTGEGTFVKFTRGEKMRRGRRPSTNGAAATGADSPVENVPSDNVQTEQDNENAPDEAPAAQGSSRRRGAATTA